MPREFLLFAKSVHHPILLLILHRLLAAESRSKNDQTQWLIYWVVYTLFRLIEYSRYTFIHTLPGYWLVKCIFLIWLMLSGQSGGTYLIYRRSIFRFLFEIFQVTLDILREHPFREEEISN
jgi:hypothetical protein